MKLHLIGDVETVRAGCEALAGDLGIELCSCGFPLELTCRPGNTVVEKTGDRGSIAFDEPCRFFRGLALFLSRLETGADFRAEEEIRVRRSGLSLDVSRNAAPTLDTVKLFLRKEALMGMNVLMLYMEDMYPMPGVPKFGYMRGGYSAVELREIDDYASALGIEVVPYIQTLAHMSQVLKWDELDGLRDTGDIFLAGSDETYAFIDSMIASVSGIFRSRRINLGMDEAHDLGSGRYRTIHGFRRGRDILREHLAAVAEIAAKYGLRGIIASDMLFADDDGEALVLPDNIDLMYWDYDRTDPDEFSGLIARHKRWGRTPMYLGTVRTWESFSTAYADSASVTRAAIRACVREGVEEAVISVWMNDGAENSLLAAMPGLAFFSGEIYSPSMAPADFSALFKVQTGADYESFLLLGEIDNLRVNGKPQKSNASKYLLWQDPLLGLFDYHAAMTDAQTHYGALAVKMSGVLEKTGEYRPLFEMMAELCRVLEMKSTLGVRITERYAAGDIDGLNELAEKVIPELIDGTERLQERCFELWMSTLKPFGFELLDARFGALERRLRTAAKRILDYTAKNIARIEELEEKRQPFSAELSRLPTVLTYDRMLSVGHQGGPTR